MKDEIKEILGLLNFNRDTISNGTCRVEDFMSREQIIKLLDYITNLQEENEKLLKKSYSDDVRITKAIETLKLCNSQCSKETINILEGE